MLEEEDVILASDSEEAEETRARGPDYWKSAVAAIQEGRAAFDNSTRLRPQYTHQDVGETLVSVAARSANSVSPPRKRVKVCL